jgi:predicted MFS family arabinose efflux permease
VRTDAGSPDLAGAWVNASANFGIAGGAALGGLVLDGAGLQTTAWVAAALLAASASGTLLLRRSFGPGPLPRP